MLERNKYQQRDVCTVFFDVQCNAKSPGGIWWNPSQPRYPSHRALRSAEDPSCRCQDVLLIWIRMPGRGLNTVVLKSLSLKYNTDNTVPSAVCSLSYITSILFTSILSRRYLSQHLLCRLIWIVCWLQIDSNLEAHLPASGLVNHRFACPEIRFCATCQQIHQNVQPRLWSTGTAGYLIDCCWKFHLTVFHSLQALKLSQSHWSNTVPCATSMSQVRWHVCKNM